jgi:iron complex outermembrane receptor protein
MLVGEAYRSRADDRLDYTRYGRVPPLFDIQQDNSGSSLLLRREQATEGGGKLEWQLSAQTSVIDLETLIREQRQTVAGEFQHSVPSGTHELIWGGSYRLSHDDIQLPNSVVFDRAKFAQKQRDWRLASIFVHDDYALIPTRLHLSGGVRVDFDSWSGTQVQPDIRLAYTPSAETTWWTSLARASRTPSRLELDVPFLFSETPAVPPAMPAIDMVRLAPAQDSLKAETVTSLEAGWRSRINAELSLDLSVFTTDYSGIVSLSTQPMQLISPALVVVPLTSINGATARTHGFELAVDWQINPGWRLQSSYSRLYLSSPTLADPAAAAEQSLWLGRVARDRASLRSAWTLGNGHQFDLWLKHVSNLTNPPVRAYTELDLRYALPLGGRGKLALIGQNLLNQRHPEFVSDYLPIQQTEVARSLLLKATWHF